MKTNPFVIVHEQGRQPMARELAAAQLRKWRAEYRRLNVKRLMVRNCYTLGDVTVVVPTPWSLLCRCADLS